MNFVLLINLKLLTNATSFLLNIAEHENFSANIYENASYRWYFLISEKISCSAELSSKKKLYNLGVLINTCLSKYIWKDFGVMHSTAQAVM